MVRQATALSARTAATLWRCQAARPGTSCGCTLRTMPVARDLRRAPSGPARKRGQDKWNFSTTVDTIIEMLTPRLRLSMTITVCVGGVFVAMAAGQQSAPVTPKPSFEVASVKPNKSGEPGMSITTQPGGRYVATNVPVAMLIRNAYELQASQLVGVPDWAASERFDITAKAEHDIAPTNQKPNPHQLMLQSLLEERFNLKVHRETRDLPGYALVVARADGKLGPQMKQSDVDCAALAAARRAGGPPPPLAPGEWRPCSMRMGRGTLTAGSMKMANLAGTLSSAVQRVVVDRTGLAGGFDFDLTFSMDQSADASAPSIFTAVQEQLGLKLDSVRIPTDVLVVDSIERPTPD